MTKKTLIVLLVLVILSSGATTFAQTKYKFKLGLHALNGNEIEFEFLPEKKELHLISLKSWKAKAGDYMCFKVQLQMKKGYAKPHSSVCDLVDEDNNFNVGRLIFSYLSQENIDDIGSFTIDFADGEE